MTRADELPDSAEEILRCHRCGRVGEPIEMQKCPSCSKLFCNDCAYRIGGREYCGRPCGESIFFGDPSEDEEGGGEE